MTQFTNVRRLVESANLDAETLTKRNMLLDIAHGKMTPPQPDENDQQYRERMHKARTDRQQCKISLVAWEDALAAAALGAGLEVRDDYEGSIRAEYEWAFSVGCELHVQRDYDWSDRDRRELPNGLTVSLYGANAKINISWSGTGRTVSQAAACVSLYGQVVAKAQLIQQALGDTRYMTKGRWEELEAMIKRTPEEVAAEKAEADAKRKQAQLEAAAAVAAKIAREAKRAAKNAAPKVR